MTDPFRLSSPAAERNRQPILEVLRRVLPPSGRALEIASGSGQHVSWFARHLPAWNWQPTEYAAESLTSIAAWSVLGDGDVAESHSCARDRGPAAERAAAAAAGRLRARLARRPARSTRSPAPT